MPDIPLKSFGKTGVKISALGLGGHHLGSASDETAAAQIVKEAIEGGITFFDNCWEYHRGKAENWMGKALKGSRDKVFLMRVPKNDPRSPEKPVLCAISPESAVCLQALGRDFSE